MKTFIIISSVIFIHLNLNAFAKELTPIDGVILEDVIYKLNSHYPKIDKWTKVKNGITVESTFKIRLDFLERYYYDGEVIDGMPVGAGTFFLSPDEVGNKAPRIVVNFDSNGVIVECNFFDMHSDFRRIKFFPIYHSRPKVTFYRKVSNGTFHVSEYRLTKNFYDNKSASKSTYKVSGSNKQEIERVVIRFDENGYLNKKSIYLNGQHIMDQIFLENGVYDSFKWEVGNPDPRLKYSHEFIKVISP